MTNSPTLNTKNVRAIMPVLVMGTFLAYLNQTLMNTALPKIMATFSITAAQGQWLSNGYMLVNGIMVPLTAYLIQRFTTRQLYLWAMSVFAIGTLICGMAPSFFVLITGRMVQAAGAGVIAPLMNVSIMYMYDAHERGTAMGWVGLALNFAPALGPTVSGYLVQTHSWRWLFFLVAPLIIVDILFALKVLRNLTEAEKIPLNWSGVVLSSIGLGAMLLGFSNASSASIASWQVLGLTMLGAIVIGIFVYQQQHTHVRLLNFNVFRYSRFNLSVIITSFLMMALYGGMLLLPLYMQNLRGYGALLSGLAMLPGAIVIAILSPLTGHLYDRYGAKYLSLIGNLILFGGTIMLSRINLHSSFLWITGAQSVRSLGLAFITMPLQTEALNALPMDMIPDGSAMFTTIRQVAGSFGTAVLIGIMSVLQLNATNHLKLHHSLQYAQAHGALQATQNTYWVAAACVVICCLLSFKLKGNDQPLPK
ncbi:MDR family MFS transporter [Loigolactobacillus bifermentans]|uniref:Multidrug transport protein n=1 Tax=Loigolactobacillus bifermentans DSM 20003 TaxID=1423726 RepID=A0A0R1GKD0_9LACO|nr:MDR family MFS transporter [Loigolactobacillus bifermentans]KRK34509.1 multidrug transport protein [Loigolactobacillus bifermentans DSM 20003]QGG61284.1 DHA2 family efflux MFS transporter permease subunit [Loigolactobacillus bifermentans]